MMTWAIVHHNLLYIEEIRGQFFFSANLYNYPAVHLIATVPNFIMLKTLIQRASTSLQLMQQIALILPFTGRQNSLDYIKLGI